MSDDRTRPLPPPGPEFDEARAARARGIQIGLIVAAALLVVAFVTWRVATGGSGDPVISPSPSPTGEPTSEPSPTEEPSPGETAEPAEDPTDEPRAATDADAAQFSESYRPRGAQGVQSVTADLDGDGEKEVVIASLHSDASRIDIAQWDGREYQVVYTGRGGGAERIDDFKVSDYNNDGRREIVTVQSVGAQGQSLSIWGWNGQAFAPQRAAGGCWDGSHTFGVVGASIQPGRIRATCDGSPLPTAAWPSDVYRWDSDARGWVYDHTED